MPRVFVTHGPLSSLAFLVIGPEFIACTLYDVIELLPWPTRKWRCL